MLGKGGMGEVYRADDLTLEQPVALKFLPEALSSHGDTLSRFRNEVRVARQVSHPNVCRVYDVGEIDGFVFLSMEYVDGEDLGSLLRRIGRLPTDKALEISRRLCAGLAAAHEKGVLHRDLKPSNVMLDARGHILLTDFGLAGLADQITGAEVRNGTPAYMAPEQLSGKEVTTKSDIYSLGLVLYELFTGKRPFEAATLADLVQAQSQSKPASLTTLVKDLDPTVERVILRCLDPEPSRRPSSALAVAAALPGGDPLAAALAAGETPSPEMIAAAGEGVGLSPRFAIPLFAVVILGIAGYYTLQGRRSALDQIQPPYSPEVLSQKARDIVQHLGFTAKPFDNAYGFDWDNDFISHVRTNDKPSPNWSEVFAARPSAFVFWYRQSPYSLIGDSYHDDLLTPGTAQFDDPALIQSGSIRLQLDDRGRLLSFERIPAQRQAPAKDVTPIDWNLLFADAGLEQAQFQNTEPLWTWLGTSDTRAAWTGKWPGSDRPLRVEAAALRGRPIGFALIGPWKDTDRQPRESSSSDKWQIVMMICIAAAIFVGVTFIGGRNLRQARGDIQGANRLATFIGASQIVLWFCRGHFVATLGTFGMAMLAIATAVFYGVVVRGIYIALEPYVRRHWPQTLMGWSAVLTGHWKDPIVGRDILLGAAVACLIRGINPLIEFLLRGNDQGPHLGSTNVLLGLRSTLEIVFVALPHGIRDTLVFFFLLFVLRFLLRSTWLAAGAFIAIWMTFALLGSSHPLSDGVENLIAYGLVALLGYRFGLLALAFFVFVDIIVGNVQATMNASVWYFGNTVFLLAFVVGLAGWACYTSMAGRKLWKELY
jgi:hypothetical protein